MPGKNPFGAVNGCLVFYPGIVSKFDSILCCKAVPGVGGTVFAGVVMDNELKGRG